MIVRVTGDQRNHLSGNGVYQDLGDYFRFADHPEVIAWWFDWNCGVRPFLRVARYTAK
jgi:hypothetical protein